METIVIDDFNLKVFASIMESEPVCEPLPTNFFINLLRLEEKYYNHDINFESLNELIAHYAVL